MWGDLKIRVPSEMVVLSPQGKPRMKQTLTALGNLARFHKQASIQLIPVSMPEAKIAFDLAKSNQSESKKEYLRKARANPLVKYQNAELKVPIDALLRTFDMDAVQMTIPAIVYEISKTIQLKGQLTLVKKLIAEYRKNYIEPIATSYPDIKEPERREDKPATERRMVSPEMAEPKKAKSKEPKAEPKKAKSKEPKAEPKKSNVEPFSVNRVEVEVVWIGGKKYIMRFFIENKMAQAVEVSSDTAPSEADAMKQLRRLYKTTDIQDEYGLDGLSNIRFIMR